MNDMDELLPAGFKRETVITFDQRDLETLIKEVWGKEYDTGRHLDYPHNGSYFDWEIDGTEYEYEDYILNQGAQNLWENETDGSFTLERVIDRLDGNPDFAPGPHDVLTALVETGKLPAGKYVLNYWW